MQLTTPTGRPASLASSTNIMHAPGHTPSGFVRNSPINTSFTMDYCSATVAEKFSNSSSRFSPTLFPCVKCPGFDHRVHWCCFCHYIRDRCTMSSVERSEQPRTSVHIVMLVPLAIKLLIERLLTDELVHLYCLIHSITLRHLFVCSQWNVRIVIGGEALFSLTMVNWDLI